MKEFGKIAAITVGATVLAVLAMLAINKWKVGHFLPNNYDSSVQVTQADINNPDIVSIADALELQQKMKAERETDSLFLKMGKLDMHNVVGVLINKGVPNIRKMDIVGEFKAGRAVYENLPTQESKSNQTTTQNTTKIAEISLENEGTTTVTEAPPTRVGSSADTIINGNKYKKIN